MCLLAEAHYHSKHREKDVGPTYGFAASPEVGPGTTVGTLQTGYRRLQASSQDKEGGRATTCRHVSRSTEICLPAEVGSEATTCPAAPEPASLVQRAPAPPRVSWLWNLPPYREGSRLPCVLRSPVAH
jgi:hypothetical protein